MDRDQTPRRWLMTDERLGDRLFEAIGRLEPGDGLVFRHHGLDEAARRTLGEQVAAIAAERRLVLSVSRDAALAHRLGATWIHNPSDGAEALRISRSVHDEREARHARGAALAFVSPVFATRSHPGAMALGPVRARALAKLVAMPAIALGGVDEERFAALGAPFVGWAGIDAFLA